MASNDRDRVILATLVFAVLLSQVLIYPGIAGLVAALGAETELNASMWFLASEFLGYISLVTLWGLASDRLGKRRPLILLGAIGGAIGYALVPLLAVTMDITFDALLAIRFVQGALTIGAFSLAMTMLMDLRGGHGRNMGAAGIAIGLGTGIGAPIGGVLSSIDPLAPMVVASGLLFAVGLGTAAVTDRTPASTESVLATLGGLRRTPAMALPYAFGLIDRLTAGFFALVGTLYFQAAFGLTYTETGFMLALFFFPFAMLQYPFGRLSDRIGRTIPVILGSTLYGVGVIGVGLAPMVEIAGLAMIAVGVLGALMAPATMALVTDLAPATDRGTAMGGFNLFGSIGFLAGFIVGGTVTARYDYLTAFVVAGGLEILIALVAIPLFIRLDVPSRVERR
ncbi:MAG: MFS transporter [Halobacteriota archaeon]